MTVEATPSELAKTIGDTFICWQRLSPLKQWVRIVGFLEANGWRLTRNDAVNTADRIRLCQHLHLTEYDHPTLDLRQCLDCGLVGELAE